MMKKPWFHFLMSFLILVVTGFLVRSHSRVTDIWVTHIVYFLAVFLSIKYSSTQPKKVLATYLAGFLIPMLLVQVFESANLLFQLNIISFTIAMVGGYIFATSGSVNKKGVYVLVAVGYCAFAVMFLAERFLHYDNFRNFEGVTLEKVYAPGFISNDADTLELGQADKMVLLDFWTTACGVCFQKFPELQTVYDEYKDDERVEIYAVNVPLKRDTGMMAEEMIKTRSYSFPVYYANAGIDTQLNVRAYPTALLISNNTIVARGDIQNVARILKERLQ